MEQQTNQSPEETPSVFFKELLSWVKMLSIALVLGLVISFFIKPALVSGPSMDTTLHDKDYLLLNRIAYQVGMPAYKDIVVFHSIMPGERVLIKRVIATEGQKISIKDGKVYVNDKLLNEPYIHGVTTSGNFEGVVPQGKIYVMGDNRGNSADSRMIGYVNVDTVIGKVMFRMFPFKGIES